MNHRYPPDWETLRYDRPAAAWTQALPLGNGSMGAMIYGGVSGEIIPLNNDTLWTGYPRDTVRQSAFEHLAPVRQKVLSQQYRSAQSEIEHYMLGDYDESYLPMADLKLCFDDSPLPDSYSRTLSLSDAAASVDYQTAKGRIHREAFLSCPDQIFVYHWEASGGETINLKLELTSRLACSAAGIDGRTVLLTGEAPSYLPPHNMYPAPQTVYGRIPEEKGMRFAVCARVLAQGGAVRQQEGQISVKGAGQITILVTSATSFNGYKLHPYIQGRDEVSAAMEQINRAPDYRSLKERHVWDYSDLYSRVSLELGGPDRSHIPTDKRIKEMQDGKDDFQLASLLFQYGRYLLIASSRPGTQPAGLQGIWNSDLPPYWSSGWTANINLEMNYWPAEICALPECHQPLLDLVRDLSEAGAGTARVLYGCRGFTAHHNIDLWRKTTPAEFQFDYISAGYSFWPMGGTWLCLHLWEHFNFTQNKEYLASFAWPIMKQAALFCLDWLTESPDHYLVTNPSTSPENAFLTPEGERCNVSMASTMDITLIWELFTACIGCCGILDQDKDFAAELQTAKDRLYPLKTGTHGQLLEWFREFEEEEPGHRHVSHLVGLYPGTRILQSGDKYKQAAEEVLKRRSTNQKRHGWGLAWLISLYARLGRNETAGDCVLEMVRDSVYPNLFDLHPPLSEKETMVFQIDGNFGYTAGVAEMLLQSHDGSVHLLPALPASWPDGFATGLRARGGYTADMEWKQGELLQARIAAAQSGPCTVVYGERQLTLDIKAGECKIVRFTEEIFS